MKDIQSFSIDNLTRVQVNESDMLSASETFVPSRISFNAGNGAYRVFNSDEVNCWATEDKNGMADLLAASIDEGVFFAEEITMKQYEDMKNTASITAIFDYGLPFKDFCSLIAEKPPQESDYIGAIAEVSFSTASTTNLFLKDNQNKYYGITLSKPGEYLSQCVNEHNTKNTVTYFPMDSYLGEAISNKTLVPVELNAELNDFVIQRDFDIKDSKHIDELAKRFFSESFDFVRKIEEESGKTVYMYGYGRRILIADVDGTLEYKMQAQGDAGSLSYLQAFEVARAFINRQGGFFTESGQELKPYLKDGEYNFDKSGGSRFVFGIKCGKYPLLSASSDAIVVEVSKGQVTYFKKCFVSFSESNATRESRQAMSAINVIAKNYKEIYNVMEQNMLLGEDEKKKADRFSVVSDKIENMSYGYVFGGDNIARSAWILTYDKQDFQMYFSLYDGEFLGYRVN
ncbi:MAG: hypothetical protein PHX63_04725 [Eubacteriales bacterium]|nr:hypothetical protein [Eubacteriales bacterium]